MSDHVLPTPEEVANTFTHLLGKKVAAKKIPSIDHKSPMAVGVYVTDGGVLRALAVADVAAAGSMGAALVMLPKGVVEDAIDEKKMGENLLENYREVVNIGASLFNRSGGPRMILKDAIQSPPDLPEEIQILMTSAKSRLDLEINVEGYRTGKMTFFL